MLLTYYISLTEDTFVKTYFAVIKDTDQKFGFKRTFMKAETYNYEKERAYYITIHEAGVFEQSIKVYTKESGKLIRRERKWFLYDGDCLHEIERREVLHFLKKIKELAVL